MLNNEILLQRGLEKAKEVDGDQVEAIKQVLEQISPDLGKYLLILFGEFYNRPQLNLHQRELITLAALTAQGGCEKQLRVHIQASLNVGLTKDEIIETFIHCICYLGFPKVLNAIFVAKEVFENQDKH